MKGSNCCFLTHRQVSQEINKVVWNSHLFKYFLQFVVLHTVEGFSVVNEAEVDVFLEFSCFLYDPIGCWQFPLPFLNPVWTCGSSRFTHCWSLAWRILSITLLTCEMSAIMKYTLNILWYCLSLVSEWKLTFSSPVATAEFSKFAGILSAAIS